MRRRRLLLLALASVCVVATATAGLTAPIPSQSGPGEAVPFIGQPRPADPVEFGEVAPRHPYMAKNARSNIHNDAYQSDAYRKRPGPLGYQPSITSTFLAHECGSLTFDSKGRLLTVCIGLERPVLHLMDPDTLESLAQYDLPLRPPGGALGAFSSFAGGAYFYLDHKDRVVVPTTEGHILMIRFEDGQFRLKKDFDVTRAVQDSTIVALMPGWGGLLWFVTEHGGVGVLKRSTERLRAVQLGERIHNSFAATEDGGIYIVTNRALYRFDAKDGRPDVTWREKYDRGLRQKPGQTQHGSGTTPTVIRRGDRHYVAITDNADPRMHVLVYRAGRKDPGKPFCTVPVFPAGQGSTDNSLIAIGKAIIVENNYGYLGPGDAAPSGPFRPTPTTVPGLTRIDVDYKDERCEVRWTNTDIRVPSVVPKASAATGLIYVYEHPSQSEIDYVGARPARRLAADPWYFTAVDLRTGRRVWSQLVGYGLGYNNHYAPVTLGSGGTAYVGVLGGLVRIRDTAGPFG